MTVAETLAPLVRAAVSPEAPVAIKAWDGSRVGPPNGQWALKINNRRGLRRLLWAPNELGFARAYVSGDIEIEGDLLAGMEVLEQMSDPTRGPGVRIDTETKKALAKTATAAWHRWPATEAAERGSQTGSRASARQASRRRSG